MIQSDPEIHIHDHGLCGVLQVEPLPQAGDEADREFQPLGAMDAHDAHRIRIFILETGLAVVDVVFFHLLHIADEMKQTEIAGLFKALRTGQKHFQIGPPLLSAGKGGSRVQIARLLQEFSDQLMDGQINGQIAEPLQKDKKARRFFPDLRFLSLPRIDAQAFIQPSLLLLRPDQGDLPVRKKCRRAFEHAEKRDILQGIVQNPQEIQNGLHLGSRKISRS